jgi:RNA polymerase sigma-70 factor (ECF subfamily)
MPTDDAAPLRRPLRDPDGFVDLYRREGELILLFCTRRVLDPETALDLTAETFAQAYVARRRFRGSSEVEARAWLLTIARRRIARYLERGRLDRRLVERLGIRTPALHPDETEEIRRRADVDGLRSTIAEELERLTADQRAALQLRIVEERSYEEVAASLGVTEATARARVSRGLRALGATLEPRLTAKGERA